jgi:hypothetical protein
LFERVFGHIPDREERIGKSKPGFTKMTAGQQMLQRSAKPGENAK